MDSTIAQSNRIGRIGIKTAQPVAGMYYGGFRSRYNIEEAFWIGLDASVDVLYANYIHEGSNKRALVIFWHKATLYAVEVCLPYKTPLDGQWEPQETSGKEMRERLASGEYERWEGIKDFIDSLPDNT